MTDNRLSRSALLMNDRAASRQGAALAREPIPSESPALAMPASTMPRRAFLRTAGGTAAAWGLGRLGFAADRAAPGLTIDQPFHGAVLNHRYGKPTAAGLAIDVTGRASGASDVRIDGRPARREGDRYVGRAVLHSAEQDIVVTARVGDQSLKQTARGVWDRYSFPRYRVAIDDNGFFLRDIHQKQYGSLFDCFYLNMLRGLNEKYGAKFVLNLFFKTGDFTLDRFPDRYRSEWADNADWLKLAFHAYTEFPSRPYEEAPPAKLLADMRQVNEQIVRFAGEASFSPTTVTHFGMIRPDAWKPLAEAGVKTLSGYFIPGQGKRTWDINYRMDDRRSEYLSRHDALRDFESGITFSRIDIVINSTPIEEIVPKLSPLTQSPNTAEIMDLLTHEQYFWPFYHNYLPDHPQRMETTIRWCTEQGYKPVFLHEGLLGAPAPG